MSPMMPTPLEAPMSYRARGFTLIELMVVVAIVAILVAIAYPSYQDAVRKGHRGQAKADLVELAQRAERFRTINGTYQGFAIAAPDNQSPRQGTARYQVARADDGTDPTVFRLTAAPLGAQQADVRCMTLTINQLGERDIDGGTGQASECW